jgi:hypothetical protein
VQRNPIGEQPGPDVRRDEQRGGRQQDGGQSWRDRPGAAARNRGTGPDPRGAPRMPMRSALIASRSTTSAESVMWPSNIAMSQVGPGSGSRQQLGVTIAVLASA